MTLHFFWHRFFPRLIPSILIATCLPVSLTCFATADYGPAVDRMITGCTKWYTSGYGHKFCVVHDMEGYYLTGISYLRRCDIQSSCHYVVSGKVDYSGDAPGGEISQLVREAHYAWHARCWNQHSLGAEHEGFANNPAWYTDAMYQASALLFRHWCDKFGIPKDRNHIVAHGQKSVAGWPSWASANLGIDPYCNDHTDPGPYWDWTKYMGLITGATDDAAFVSKTLADGTAIAPGQAFSCTFVMRNNGTTTWIAAGGDGYTFNNNGGTAMGAPFATHLSSNVGPGGNASFTINFTAPATPGTYTATFRLNSSSYVYFGDQVSITVNVATPVPTITAQPASITRNAGETATFTVGASGATSYQWKRNGVNLANGGRISGATSATLAIASAQLSDAGFYTVSVANSGGSVLSSEAQLTIAATAVAVGTGNGLRGLYYDNTDLSSIRLARVDSTINFDWGAGAPSSAVDADTFAVTWTGQVEPRFSQTYTFHTRTDDGVRLWVNNVLLVDKWVDQGATEWTGAISLTAGQKYDIRMDYYEQAGSAAARLSWSSASQAKEVIPASQLYRPAIVLPVIASQAVRENNLLRFSIVPGARDQVAGVTAFEDFESYADGSASDIIMFRKPGNSSSTSAFLDTSATNYTATTASFPGTHGGARVLRANWTFAAGAVNPWLRLTTANTQNRPNPTVSTIESLWFDVRADKAVKVALGIRETDSTAAIGENGGTAGTIEFVGAGSKTGTAPNPSRTVSANTWTTLKFNLPAEPCVSFTGNGLLESTTGKGVLEHLAIVPGGGLGAYNLYLDNFAVIQNVDVAYSLEPGAPAGAAIHPTTGEFTWTPSPGQGPGTYTIAYRVTDNGSSPRSSVGSFMVTVNAGPVITAHPVDQTVSPGATVTFSATVSGTSPLSYQWLFEGNPIPDATNATFVISSVQSSDAGAYGLSVTNLYGEAQSSNATLIVSLENSPPSITAQPQDAIVNQGQSAQFCVSVVGTSPLSYQWLFDDQPLNGQIQRCYTLNNVQGPNAGNYQVIITNEFGSVTSSVAVLAVNLIPHIDVEPQAVTVDQGGEAVFTVVASGTAPLNYQWRKNGNPITGATKSSLVFSSAQGADAATYSVVVSNMAGQDTSLGAVLAVNVPPSITSQPASQEVSAGANVVLSVGTAGTAPLSFQWRKNGAPIAGAIASSLPLNNFQSANVGVYSVIVSNRLGTVTSADAIVGLSAFVLFEDDFESGTLSQWANGGSALANTATWNHTSGGSRSAEVDLSSDKIYHNLGAELDGHVRLTFWAYDDTAANVNSGQTRWFGELRAYSGAGYTNGSLQQLFAIGRYGVNFGTSTGTLAGQSVNTTNYHARVFAGPNSGFLNLSVQRSVGWHKFEIERLADGSTVRFYVDGVLGATVTAATFAKLDSVGLGSVALGTSAGNAWFDDVKVEYFDPPSITSHPTTQTVSLGATANFSAVATNNAFNYQWRKDGISLANGAGISGATTPSLTVTGVDALDAGTYTLVSWNGAGAVVSSAASLLVHPMITAHPVSRTNLPGTQASFTVAADGQTPLSFQWRKNGVNLSDVVGVVSGTHSATLVIESVGMADEASYTVVVSNPAGTETSQAATLSVVELPAITSHPGSQSAAAGQPVTFNASATGSEPLTLQWLFNGSPMPGQTNMTLLIASVQPADAGEYTLQAANQAGTATSDPAVLSVNTKPSLVAIADVTVHAGMMVSVTNSASDPEAPPQSLNFTLDAHPPEATLDPETGVLTWQTTSQHANSTNTMTIRVTDNGTPSLYEAASFSVVVVEPPKFLSAEIQTNDVALAWTAIAGMTYGVQVKDSLSDETWADLVDVTATNNTATLKDAVITPYGAIPLRFFRVIVRE